MKPEPDPHGIDVCFAGLREKHDACILASACMKHRRLQPAGEVEARYLRVHIAGQHTGYTCEQLEEAPLPKA